MLTFHTISPGPSSRVLEDKCLRHAAPSMSAIIAENGSTLKDLHPILRDACQVEPGAVLAAAKARLAEERSASQSAEAFRGPGERLRRWQPLSQSFQQADHALQRNPRVFRAAADALQSAGQRKKNLPLLTR